MQSEVEILIVPQTRMSAFPRLTDTSHKAARHNSCCQVSLTKDQKALGSAFRSLKTSEASSLSHTLPAETGSLVTAPTCHPLQT